DSAAASQQEKAMQQPPTPDGVPHDRRRSTQRRAAQNTDKFGTGLERRRGPGRRRSDFIKSAEEGELTPEQFLFVMAIAAYKRSNDRPYPTWTEVLEVIRKLGYRKTCTSELNLDNCEDWTEPAEAPVFPETPAESA
ncbi:MAG: hypothetical protein QF735_09395, partial [Phycisphaeraceae bacterium]|nr:hypothetical protein [Phycisphaeraceae bacterium]